MKTYNVGQMVRITGTWKDNTGALIDPQTVAFSILLPDGSLVTKTYLTDNEVAKDSVGIYHMDYTIVQDGRHWYSALSTGSGASFEETAFHVKKTKTVAQ